MLQESIAPEQDSVAFEVEADSGIRESDIGAHALSLERVSAVLSAGDAEDLRSYLRTGGFGAFEHSLFGAMLARAELFGKTARPCKRCGGDAKRWIGGSGFVNKETGVAPKEASSKQKAWLEMLDIELPPALGDTVCGDCKGRGWGLPRMRTQSGRKITARPMGSSVRQQGGFEMDVAQLARLGRVSGLLNAVHARSIVAAATLEVGFAPDGTSRSAGWHLVPAGIKMLRTNPQKLPPAQFFQNERAAQVKDPKPNRKALFDAAESQWVAQFEGSCRLWNLCKTERLANQVGPVVRSEAE